MRGRLGQGGRWRVEPGKVDGGPTGEGTRGPAWPGRGREDQRKLISLMPPLQSSHQLAVGSQKE